MSSPEDNNTRDLEIGGPDDPRPALLAQDMKQLTAELQRADFSAFRAKQIFHWLYQHGATSVEQMKNIPRDLRNWLATFYRLGGGQIIDHRKSVDGSVKFLVELFDGHRVESVLMQDEDRRSLCVSTQVGCSLACRFCLTGKGGFVRNCTSDEILGQYLAARRELAPGERPITHIVVMGMGEPMLNIDEVIEALRRLIDPQAIGLSPRRITVSTAGVIEGIRKLGESGLNVKLAISLNATTDDQRSQLMPVNRRHNIADLLQACREYPLTRRHRITFEYVMIDGFNDSHDDARRLAKLLRGIPCKINLIPFNPVPRALPYSSPPEKRVEEFRELLAASNYTASIRRSKGADVGAACGQLAGHVNVPT